MTLLDLLSRQPVWVQMAALAVAMMVVIVADHTLGRWASLASVWILVLAAAVAPAPKHTPKSPRGREA